MNAKDGAQPSPLVHGRDGAQGGEDGQEKAEAGHDGNRDRAEDENHQQDAEAEDSAEIERQGVRQFLRNVNIHGRQTGHAQSSAGVVQNSRRLSAKFLHDGFGGL